jgi:flagellar hook-length control protein FliK
VAGEFSGLLSKLGARGQEPKGEDGVVESDVPPVDGDPLKLLMLLESKTPAQDATADAVTAAADQSAAKLLIALAHAAGLPVPAQPAGDAAPAQEPAAGKQDVRGMLPDDAPMEGEAPPEVKAVQTTAVVKRETHLGSGSAGTESMNEWSASMLAAQGAGERPAHARTSSQPAAADMTRVALADEQSTRGLTQEAIAALKGSRPGGSQVAADARPGGSPVPTRATDGAPAFADVVEHTNGGMRPELTSGGAVASAPVQFLAGRIAEEAAALSQPAPGAGSAAAHANSSVMTPTKVLHIQLQPVELGTVTMKLSLKDNTLQVELEVGRGDTKTLIQNDRDALTALLRSAGYMLEGVDVRLADTNSTSMSGGGAQAGVQAQSGGSSQTDGQAPGARGQDDGRGPRQGHDGGGRNAEGTEAGSRAGVFV